MAGSIAGADHSAPDNLPLSSLAINKLRHKSSKDSFKQPLFVIAALQFGAVQVGLWWRLTG